MDTTENQNLPEVSNLGTVPETKSPMPPPPTAAIVKTETPTDSPPQPNKLPISPNKLLILGALVVVGVGMLAGIALTYRQQLISKQAWKTEQSAESLCINGSVGIVVSFTNTELVDSNLAMDVVAQDLQTSSSKDLGTVQPQNTQTDTLLTDLKEIEAGQVRFDLTWSNGKNGVDQRISNYDAITCKPEEPVSCPLQAKEDGQYLVEFSEFIRADGVGADAQISKDIQLPEGTYTVTLASFDTHDQSAQSSEDKEQYLVIFKDEQDEEVARSSPIADLPEDQNYLTEVAGQVTLDQPITSLTALHAAFEDAQPQKLRPICVLLTKETVTPPSSASPTAAPTATPVTNACNTTCSQDNQCNVTNASLVCYEGRCRHRDNKTDTGCNLPEIFSCNSDCTNDNQCLSANSDFACIQGNCRHRLAPADESCQPPIGGPEPTPTPAVNGFGATATPTPATVAEVDLPEAGIHEPTLSVLLFGGLFVLLGVGVLLVP